MVPGRWTAATRGSARARAAAGRHPGPTGADRSGTRIGRTLRRLWHVRAMSGPHEVLTLGRDA